MKIALFGCGYIGEKRGKDAPSHQIVGVYDPDQARAQKLAQELRTTAFETEEALLSKSGADIVIIAAINKQLAPLALKSIEAGKHVLVEKPAAISVKEIKWRGRESGFQPSLSPGQPQSPHSD
jgi:predicted dehydrogenase